VVAEFVDIGISGAKDRRPELDKLMADARRRKFDVIAVWRFDRFARASDIFLRARRCSWRGIGREVGLSAETVKKMAQERSKIPSSNFLAGVATPSEPSVAERENKLSRSAEQGLPSIQNSGGSAGIKRLGSRIGRGKIEAPLFYPAGAAYSRGMGVEY